jgi:hypothetical protein
MCGEYFALQDLYERNTLAICKKCLDKIESLPPKEKE